MKPKDRKNIESEELEFEKEFFQALKRNGYLFPKSLEDVKKFEELYGDTEIDMPEHLQTYDDLISSKQGENVFPNLNLGIAAFTSEPNKPFTFLKNKESSKKNDLKPRRIDYYKRILLAAEIVHQLHQEPTLGHLKLQKLVYLSQEVNAMNLPTNFLRQAAGPYDPKMARSLDKKLEEKNWFKYRSKEYLKYAPLDKAGEHLNDFNKYFSNELDGIQFLIETFRNAKSAQVELVATIYACWKEIISSDESFSINLITQQVYGWSEQKKKFSSSRIEKAVNWMIEKGLTPI